MLSSPQSFVTAYPSPVAQICGQGTVLTVEGDQHADLRTSVDDHFASEAVPRVVDLTGEVATGHADALRDRGGAELTNEYFKPVTAATLGRFVGLPDIDTATLIRWSEHMIGGFDNPSQNVGQHQRAATAAAEVTATIEPRIEHVTAHPDDSLLSQLLRTGCPVGEHGRRLRSYRPSSTSSAPSSSPPPPPDSPCWPLLHHPEQLHLVQKDPARLRGAVREALRFRPPIGTLGRTTTMPVTLNGQRLPEGAVVAAAVASANRDPAVYPYPDRFDIDRRSDR